MAVLQAQRQTGLPCRALIKSVKCGGRGTWWRRAVKEKRNQKGSYALWVLQIFLCHVEKANKENNVAGVEFISGERERKEEGKLSQERSLPCENGPAGSLRTSETEAASSQAGGWELRAELSGPARPVLSPRGTLRPSVLVTEALLFLGCQEHLGSLSRMFSDFKPGSTLSVCAYKT